MSSIAIYKTCPKCRLDHILPGRFCSRKCANSRSWSQEDKIKKSLAAKEFSKTHVAHNKGKTNPKKGMNQEGTFCYVSWCKVCSKQIRSKKLTCSRPCELLHRSLKMKNNLRKGRNFTKSGWYVSPFAGRVYLESSWERLIAEDLDANNISWVRPKYIKYILDGRTRMYYPDFFLVDYNCYLDPKNPHVQDLHAKKIQAVISQNNVKLLILNKNQLTWQTIKDLL